MKDKIIKYCSENKRLRFVYMIAAGVFAGLLESAGISPILCLVGMLPLFTVLECDGCRAVIRRVIPFLAAYNITKTAFLLTVYTFVDVSFEVGILLSIGAIASTAAIMFLAQLFCMWFYGNIRTGKSADIVSVSLLFAMSEWISGNIGPFSFPWIGVWAQAEGASAVLMSANLLGCRFTSFLILLANGMVYLAVRAVFRGQIKHLVISVCSCAVLSAAVFTYGNIRISTLKKQSESAPKATVLTAQLDSEGNIKHDMSAWDSAVEYIELMEEAFDNAEQKPEIVFLPETAVHASFDNGDAFQLLENFARRNECYIVTGCFWREGEKKYNGVIVYTPEGLSDSIHFKSHLIPFGEYMPLAELTGADRMIYEPDSYGEPIEAGGVKIACGICIESLYADVFTDLTRQGAQMIFIPTNDSWFGDTFARRAHYLHSKMRAIENSRFAARAGNCGISAVITPCGDELAIDSSKNKGTLIAAAPLLEQKSPYTVLGDVFAIFPAILMIVSAVKAILRLKSRQKLSQTDEPS